MASLMAEPGPLSTPCCKLRERAVLYRQIRDFFWQRDVLEMDAPLLGNATGCDPNLDPVTLSLDWCGQPRQLFLQTSPEFAMKRLLASGAGAIYSLGKAFRDGEAGARHNPEFTMLEWYRPGLDHLALMDEVYELLEAVLGPRPLRLVTYREAFQAAAGIDPLSISDGDLARDVQRLVPVAFDSATRDQWLDLLFSHVVEPYLSPEASQDVVILHDYPASQAALARTAVVGGVEVAQRFEVFCGGMELANGYHELIDAEEQRRRFATDQHVRQALGKPCYPVDEAFLTALDSGIPACAGVALGVDRLLMLKMGVSTINEVLDFPIDSA